MTKREVLERLYEEGSFEGEHRDIHPNRIEIALQELVQIEESERLGVEEIKEIIKEYLGCNDHRGWNWDTNLEVFDKTFAIIPESQLKEMSQAIHEAQERKSKGVSR